MQKIITFLWFDTQAEEAANFYVSIFKNSKVTNVSRNGDTVFSVNFELDGVPYYAMNGGPMFKFTEAISLFVDCADQAEVDELWDRLVTGGEPSRCGWLKDKFGLSWQIIPKALGKALGNPDPAKAQRAMEAMLQMSKINVAELEAATA